jgi:hypothetical protein
VSSVTLACVAVISGNVATHAALCVLLTKYQIIHQKSTNFRHKVTRFGTFLGESGDFCQVTRAVALFEARLKQQYTRGGKLALSFDNQYRTVPRTFCMAINSECEIRWLCEKRRVRRHYRREAWRL